MARDRGTSGWRVLLVLVLVLFVLGGLWLGWRELGRGGLLLGPDETVAELRERLALAEDNASALAEDNASALAEDNASALAEDNASALAEDNEELRSEAEGIPIPIFVGLIVAVVILLLVFATAYGQIGGKNIDRLQAKRLATQVVREDHGWNVPVWEDLRAPGGGLCWVERLVHTGQAVDGDIDSLWYLVQFCKNFCEGGDLAPGHQCITVLIKSNDAARQITTEPGLNVREAALAHRIRLQRDPQPGEGGLASLQEHAETARALRDIVGEDA